VVHLVRSQSVIDLCDKAGNLCDKAGNLYVIKQEICVIKQEICVIKQEIYVILPESISKVSAQSSTFSVLLCNSENIRCFEASKVFM